MEDPTSPTTNPSTEPASPWPLGLGQSLDEQRRQIEKFLASRRERMGGVEPELTESLVQLVDELIRSRSEANAARDELQSREAGLQRQTEHVERMRAELDAIRADFDAGRAEWEEARRATEKQQSAMLEQIQNQRQEQQQLFQRQFEETMQRQSALDEAREEFHNQRQEFLQTISRHNEAVEQFEARCKELDSPAVVDNSEEIRRLTEQRDEALRNLEESERSLAEAHTKLFELANAGTDSEASSGGEEYQERYQLSLQDIRELRAENEELKAELARAKSRPQAAEAVAMQAAGSISWEAQKQKLLAALESEYDENEPEDAKQRTEIEEIVRKTDLAISQKDDEIQELKKLLESQSENIGTVAVGAAAFGELLDSDQIIQEERESLKQLQEEMRRKLAAAEIEISVERAKIARQRVELEEKMRQQAQNQSDETSKNKNEPDGQEKPIRGRWLSRLGLNDIDQ